MLSTPTVTLRDVLQGNAFRLLGLPGEATWGQILDAAKALQGQASTSSSTPWDLPCLGPPRRDAVDIEDALARLADPDLRLLDRMFWFHDRDAESAVAYLTPDSIRDAIEGWSGTSLPVALHDAAVVTLVAAMILEPGMDDIALWQRTIRTWTSLMENDAYWLAFMKAELAGGFERLASLGSVRNLRESGLGYVTDTVVSVARETQLTGKPKQAMQAIRMLRDELPPEMFEATCGDLARVLGVHPVAARRDPEPRPSVEPRVSVEPGGPAGTAKPEPSAYATPWWASRNEPTQPQAASPAQPQAASPAPAAPVIEPVAARVEPSVSTPPAAAANGKVSVAPVEPVERKPEPPAREQETSAGKSERPIAPVRTVRTPARPPLWSPANLQKAGIGVLASAIGVAPFLLLPLFATGSSETHDWVLETRMALNDQAIGKLDLERAENDHVRDSLVRDLTEARALLAEYQDRIDRGLPHDPVSYLRLESYYKAMEAQYQEVLLKERDLSERYDLRLLRRERLSTENN